MTPVADSASTQDATRAASAQRVGISKSQFQVLGPAPLQQAAGQETSPICSSSFQFISTSDDGPFSDVLLLPDTVGYLGFLEGAFATAKSRVVNGDPFWVWYADMREFDSV
jgi:hypothetical protein